MDCLQLSKALFHYRHAVAKDGGAFLTSLEKMPSKIGKFEMLILLQAMKRLFWVPKRLTIWKKWCKTKSLWEGYYAWWVSIAWPVRDWSFCWIQEPLLKRSLVVLLVGMLMALCLTQSYANTFKPMALLRPNLAHGVPKLIKEIARITLPPKH